MEIKIALLHLSLFSFFLFLQERHQWGLSLEVAGDKRAMLWGILSLVAAVPASKGKTVAGVATKLSVATVH